MPNNEGAHQLGQAINGLVNDTIAQPIARFRALPEGPEKNRRRASWGAALLTAGVYVAYTTWWSRYAGIVDQARRYVHLLSTPLDRSWPLYVWGAVMLFGLLWVTVGLRGARGPRNVMGAFWALVRTAVFGAALCYQVYLGDRSYDWWLQGFYTTMLAASLMALCLALRGPGRGAVPLVQRHILQQTRTFKLGRRRSF